MYRDRDVLLGICIFKCIIMHSYCVCTAVECRFPGDWNHIVVWGHIAVGDDVMDRVPTSVTPNFPPSASCASRDPPPPSESQ